MQGNGINAIHGGSRVVWLSLPRSVSLTARGLHAYRAFIFDNALWAHVQTDTIVPNCSTKNDHIIVREHQKEVPAKTRWWSLAEDAQPELLSFMDHDVTLVPCFLVI